jgi:hypothetical protein
MALSAVCAVILTAGITGWFRLPSPDALPRCMDSALAAFQTAQSPEEAATVWNELGAKAPNLAKQQYPDFAFIAAYTFLFFVLARIGRSRPIGSSGVAGTLVMVSATVTAVADIGENCYTLANIAALHHGFPEAFSVGLMRHCSLTKWAACGVTLVLLWWVFLPSRRGSALYRLLALTIAAFSVISGTMGILGLWDNTKIELVIPFLAPALLLQIPLFCRYWDDVLGTHWDIASQSIEAWEVNAGRKAEDREEFVSS